MTEPRHSPRAATRKPSRWAPPSSPRFDPDGLIIAIATDADNGEVLMVAHMNAMRWPAPSETRDAWFCSRSRGTSVAKGRGERQHPRPSPRCASTATRMRSCSRCASPAPASPATAATVRASTARSRSARSRIRRPALAFERQCGEWHRRRTLPKAPPTGSRFPSVCVGGFANDRVASGVLKRRRLVLSIASCAAPCRRVGRMVGRRRPRPDRPAQSYAYRGHRRRARASTPPATRAQHHPRPPGPRDRAAAERHRDDAELHLCGRVPLGRAGGAVPIRQRPHRRGLRQRQRRAAIVDAAARARDAVRVAVEMPAMAQARSWTVDVRGSTAAARKFLDNCFPTN